MKKDHKDAMAQDTGGNSGSGTWCCKIHVRSSALSVTESYMRAKSTPKSVLITEEVIKALQECVQLAPLHDPPNLLGIAACQELMPNTPMVAVFDTAFHQTMPPEILLFTPLPYEY